MNNVNRKEEENRKIEDTSTSPVSSLDSRFNQTLRNVQRLLQGRSFPGKVLITRRSNPLDLSSLHSPDIDRSPSDHDTGPNESMDDSIENEERSRSIPSTNSALNKSKASTSSTENTTEEVQKSTMGARATDSARLVKFTKELSGPAVILDKLRELAWSGVPPYLRPFVWRLLLIPFHLVTCLWDTYLAEGDALPDFLVYIFASFLLTWSDKLLKLDFQEMVMFLQHLPTHNWIYLELGMVLSRAYMWHTMFNSSPGHLAS